MSDQILPFKPLGPTVIVLPKKTAPATSAGGLIELADVYDTLPTSGMVVAIGTGFRCSCCAVEREASVKIGDFVTFDRSAGEILPIDGEGQECLLLREDELLAVIEPTAVCEVVPA